jgi:CRISPR-associated protein Cas1
LDEVGEIDNAGQLRSIEGNAARSYFHAIDSLILKDHDHFFMKERSRRPPKDRFNALLSFLYALLTNDVSSSLQSVGLDPYVGFLHTDRPGRPSLALDLMEEFRPLADRVALRVVNLGMVSSDGFLHDEGGGFMMDDGARRIVISEWQEMKNRVFHHPVIDEEVSLGLVPFIQSNLLARCIRGELDGYPPFVYRR